MYNSNNAKVWMCDMMKVVGGYSVRKSLTKGVWSGVLSIVPAIAGGLAVVLSSPDVVGAVGAAWPAVPAAGVVGVVVALLNWVKNRGR